ncbi:hypothetical protein JY651_44045 [Pyxidicoccus parkwayensis]|uniref:Uncharacterized protein n=1 Tax=Pyxidicoccus parkwayensis TaxID=2813578 RepID=A0ABX7P103_9BACT|nr:hypothetical protein [Pyxidicoccus parkwaysis]QSQ22043.1 hypothetical protein JY651_44045 [Pyxidicoccus parkwaysis]
MPEKSRATRVKQAKKKGTTLTLKATDVGRAEGEGRHKAKKLGRLALGDAEFPDRSVSPRKEPGRGNRTKSSKLPVPELGSSTSRRKTLPSMAAAAYRKEGTAKKTTGRGDTTPLKAGKAYKRRGARKTSIRA